jgi:hypothetical protein
MFCTARSKNVGESVGADSLCIGCVGARTAARCAACAAFASTACAAFASAAFAAAAAGTAAASRVAAVTATAKCRDRERKAKNHHQVTNHISTFPYWVSGTNSFIS